MNIDIEYVKDMSSDELKDIVIKSAEEFYLNKDHQVNIPDTVYDKLLEELQLRDHEFNIFDYLKSPGRTIKHPGTFPLAQKTKICDKDMFLRSIPYESFCKLSGDDPRLLITNYVRGKLNYISVYGMFTDTNKRGVIIEDYPSLFPLVLGDKTCRLAWEVTPNSTPLFIGIVPEVEFETADIKDVRLLLVKSDFYINYNIPDNEVQLRLYREMISPIEDYLANYPWIGCAKIKWSTEFSPKMDGCSSVTYYKNGERKLCLTRSDDFTGKDKTDYFAPFFPRFINWKGDLQLMHELVINLDYGFGWNSRQKANGLTNSKYNQDQVAKYATWVIYDAKDGNGDRVPLTLVKDAINTSQIVLKSEDFPLFNNRGNNDYRDLVSCPITFDYVKRILGVPDTMETVRVIREGILDDIGNIEWGFEKKYCQQIEKNPEEVVVRSQGLYCGYRYVTLSFSGQYCVTLADGRDLVPKVRVCDEFTLSNVDKFIDPEHQAYYHHSEGGTFLIDGLCVHEKRLNKKTNKVEPFHNIFKYEWNEVVETKVNKILWEESQYGSFIPIVQFDTVLVEGSWLSRASVGGWAMLKNKQINVGSRIKVVRVNSTIPQIIEVIDKIPAELPCCPHCGRQLTEEHDIVSGVVKCCNDDCPQKLGAKKWFLDKDFQFDFRNDIVDILPKLVAIERYSKARKSLPEDEITEIEHLLRESDFNGFKEYVHKRLFINMTISQYDGFCYGIKPAFDALRIKMGIIVVARKDDFNSNKV